MKTILTLLLMFMMTIATAQKTYDLDNQKAVPKTEQQMIGKSSKTSDVALYNSIKYPVYKSVNNKLFIVYKNRNGNWSKKYIKE